MSRDALIVGINSYQYLPQLKAPVSDAEAMAQRLEQDGEFKVWRRPEYIDQAHGNQPVVSATQSVSQLQLEKCVKAAVSSGQLPGTRNGIVLFFGPWHSRSRWL